MLSLAIVVPCYNEQEAFSICVEKLKFVLNKLKEKNKINNQSYILFIDDGSKDDTWELIKSASQHDAMVKGLKLSANRGHQIALIAGLANTSADISISIDADLQDDLNCIEKMIDKYNAGFEIIYGVRNDRSSDTNFKKKSARLFYSLMNFFGVNQVPDHADFRLMGRSSINGLKQFKEQNIYLRGLIPLLGYKSTNVYYSREKRVAGKSKYPLKKMLALALEGITSLSVTPLRIIALTGVVICFFSVFTAFYAFFEKINGNAVAGWASVTIAISFLGGIQMLSLGIIGEYIGKIYLESKNRPKFFIEEVTNNFLQSNEKVNG